LIPGDANVDDDVDSETGRSAIAKMSWRLLPLIGLSYLIAFMDRANISFAALQMNADLRFSATIYGLGAGLFFAGYALFEVPSNLLLVRYGARRWIARIMLTWGLISAAMIFITTPLQFYVMRFLLGVAEAGFFPGVMLYLSHWFPARWCGRAVCRFYIAVPLASIVMGGLAGALLGLNGRLGLAGWQWLFLVEALPAVIMAAALLRFLPDAPSTAIWLTPAQRAWVTHALAADVAASGTAHHGFARTLIDPRVLGIGIVLGLTFVCLNAVLFSGPKILVSATGWSVTHVGYLIACGGGMSTAAMLAAGWHSDRRRERHLHLTAMIVIAAVAVVGMALAPLMGPRIEPIVIVSCYVLFVAAALITGPLAMAMASETLHPDSRAVGLAAVNTLAQVGNFIGPVLWGIAADRFGSFQFGLEIIPIILMAAAGITLALRRNASAAKLGATALPAT
jgi:MFS transporter, ACS family, tartrate transporter